MTLQFEGAMAPRTPGANGASQGFRTCPFGDSSWLAMPGVMTIMLGVVGKSDHPAFHWSPDQDVVVRVLRQVYHRIVISKQV